MTGVTMSSVMPDVMPFSIVSSIIRDSGMMV